MVSASGLIFYYPKVKITRSGYVEYSTNIKNYPVQSLATAEIIPVAVTYMWHRMQHLEAFMTNTIHDSIITEEPAYETEELNCIANIAFTDDVYKYLKEVYNIDFDVELAVDNNTYNNWSVK